MGNFVFIFTLNTKFYGNQYQIVRQRLPFVKRLFQNAFVLSTKFYISYEFSFHNDYNNYSEEVGDPFQSLIFETVCMCLK
jgi:hypothetical protein